MSRLPMSMEHPVLERVGWPFESTPTSTLTVRDTLETETSQLPESDICGLCIRGKGRGGRGKGEGGEGREKERRKKRVEEKDRGGEGGKERKEDRVGG